MTTMKAISPKESLPIGATYSPVSDSNSVVLTCEFNSARPLPLPKTKTLDALVAEFESDEETAALMADARKTLASEWYSDEANTLTALRLAHGLSQAQLASLAHTSQPHIARIELGRCDPSTDLILRIAHALDVSQEQAFGAIVNQRLLRESKL